MDYKRVFKSRNLRHKILKLLGFIPDKAMLKLQYRIKLNRPLNLHNPKRFTEKLQLYKLYYRNPALGVCVDKYKVREFIKNSDSGVMLPRLYGVYERAEDIDFDKLPARFVIKTNDGGGGNNVVICRDKTSLDIPGTIKAVDSWLNLKSINAGREWAYTQIEKSLIIVEEFLENKKNPDGGLEDYKIFCFHGEPYCIVHDGDRYIDHKRNFYDLDWRNLHIGSDCKTFDNSEPAPENLEAMIDAARKLSKKFPFVRVDLYNVENKIYFGELTFYPWSGYVQYDPDEFDFKLGSRFDVTSFMPKSHRIGI